MARKAGERNDIPYIFHAGCKLDKTFKSEAESAVRDAAVLAQLQIPPVIFAVKFHLFDLIFQNIDTIFSLRAADDFADFGNENVHSRNCFVIIVGAHVKCFDACGIIGKDDRFFKMLFR